VRVEVGGANASANDSGEGYEGRDGLAIGAMRGTPRNTDEVVTPSDHVSTMQKEGGQVEASQGPSASSPYASSAGLIAQSLYRVRQRAQQQSDKRRLDPNRFKKVKSKVAKNVKVLTKTNKVLMKDRLHRMMEEQQRMQTVVDFENTIRDRGSHQQASYSRSFDKSPSPAAEKKALSPSKGMLANEPEERQATSGPAPAEDRAYVRYTDTRLSGSINAQSQSHSRLEVMAGAAVVPRGASAGPEDPVQAGSLMGSKATTLGKKHYVSPYKAS